MDRKTNTQDAEVHTGHGTFNLAKDADRRRLKKVVIDLIRDTDRLSEHDIANWRYACQRAVDIDNPDRQLLYDIYNDVDLDLHLSGGIGQINGFVKARSFKLTTPKGEEDKVAVKYLNRAWFKDLVDYILESIYWGHSLVELGGIITDADGRLSFDGVRLIPRKHVVPEYHRITRIQGDDWRGGIDYHDTRYSTYLIEAGRPDSLGLYKKAAMQTIPKKYALAFWDTFAEMFGIPIRIAKTSSRDPRDKAQLESMMDKMSFKAWGVFDDLTDIELVESSRGDAFNVYDQRVERANSELSKLILRQTMTIDDGSSYAQSNTHFKVFQNLIEAYCDLVRDTVNNQLLPKMAMFGFPVKDLEFNWDDPIDYSPEEQVAFETMILDNFEVDGSYFEEKYGIKVNGRRQQGLTLPELPDKNAKPRGGFFD